MTEPALVVSQSGQITRGLPAFVAARGHEPVETHAVDRPEDGQYYLSPATIEHAEQYRVELGRDELALVVDGTLHPGQMVDLQQRLPEVHLRDKRGAVWERLAEENPVAAACLDLQRCRIARREAAATQRDASTSGPSGTSGRLAASEQREQDLRSTLETRQENARREIRTSYTDADGRVVLLGRVGAPTSDLWSALTDESAPAAAGRPARPTTATATVGPHTLAVTVTSGIPGNSGLPAWFEKAVPGLPAALEAADCVLGVGEHHESLLDAVAERFDVTCRSLSHASPGAARDVLRDTFETAAYAVQLPYDDEAHALVSTLHDRAVVHATEYDDAIYLRVEVAQSAVDELRNRVSAVDGSVQPLTADE